MSEITSLIFYINFIKMVVVVYRAAMARYSIYAYIGVDEK